MRDPIEMLEEINDWGACTITMAKNGEQIKILSSDPYALYGLVPTPEIMDEFLYLCVPAHVSREALELMREADVDVSVLEH